MKTIFKIAKTELSLLFYSPIAWFLLVAFLFQCALTYTSNMDGITSMQSMGGFGLRVLRFLTANTFAPPYGIWTGVAEKLYLYLPLLTMGIMSREISSGTIKLLYSSPTTIREIVFGKYLGMVFYSLMLVAVLAILVICALFNIHEADAGLLISGLLGMFMLLCTYAAIGLFMSCLTSYQVVAALSTLVVLAILSYIGSLWQGIDFVRDLTYFLSISGRADQMFRGLITSKDILYFLMIISAFLSFSIYKLQSGRESKPYWVRIGRYTLIVVAVLTIGYISSRPGIIAYFDATATKTNTLTVNAQKILKEMGDDPIEVTSYINVLDNHFWSGRPEMRNQDMDRWEPYLRFKPAMHFKYVYFYDSIADPNLYKFNPGKTVKELAEIYAKSAKMNISAFKTPAQMREMIDLRPEGNRYVMQLKYRDRSTFLRLFDDQVVYPSETETAAALKRLLQARLPKVAFVQGELERSIDKAGDKHYKTLTNQTNFRNALVNQGFDVMSFILKDREIPKDIAGLVIADPRTEFDTASLKKIQQYIAEGGNLLIAGEPGRQQLLNPLLQQLGIQLMEGMVVQQSKDFAPSLVQSYLTQQAAGLSPALRDDAADSIVVSVSGAAALVCDKNGPFSVTPFLMTPGKSSWNKRIKPNDELLESAEASEPKGFSGPIRTSSPEALAEVMKEVQKAAAVHTPVYNLVYSPEEGDQGGSLPVVAGLTRTINGRQQRIVVAGDADFLSNSELGRSSFKTANFDFSTAVFGWFTYGEFPIDSSRPKSPDNRLTLTDNGILSLQILLLGVLPGLLLITGTLVLIRRKRK